MVDLLHYKKNKDWLICVDSDGCAMDTMDIKHYRCFGPCLVSQWQLQDWQQDILTRWNEINLYTMTRGINRFKGLVIALEEIDRKYTPIQDLDDLVNWVKTSDELSNQSLCRALEQNQSSVALRKALDWSKAVNNAIKQLPPQEILPYENVKQALTQAHKVADIAIVSSANLNAVLEEWQRHNLLEHIDIVLAQDAGSKAYCIGELVKKGYATDKVLMCGDAPGDKDAAEQNGVFYFPILVRQEKESWVEFISNGLDKLIKGCYGGEYQQQRNQAFINNLK